VRLPAKLTLGSVMLRPSSIACPGGLPCPWTRGRWTPRHVTRPQGRRRSQTKSAMHHTGRLRSRGGRWRGTTSVARAGHGRATTKHHRRREPDSSWSRSSIRTSTTVEPQAFPQQAVPRQGGCGGPGAGGHRPAVTGGTALCELTHQGGAVESVVGEGDHDVASVHDRRAGGSAASRPACRGQPGPVGRPAPAPGSRRSSGRSVHHCGTDLCPPGPRDRRPGRLRGAAGKGPSRSRAAHRSARAEPS
jgi:hypothetical protein